MSITERTLTDLRTAGLAEIDPEIAELCNAELRRQRDQLELIASENFTWPSVLEAVGSVLTNKYAEGLPGRRYYGGCEIVDEVERLAIERAKSLFGAEHANVQPHSGASANMAAYFAVLEQGDTVLGLRARSRRPPHARAARQLLGSLLPLRGIRRQPEDERIDMDELRRLAHEHRPKLIVAGGSAYPREIDARAFREIADEVGALLMVDMAHFSGLVAAGLHQNPVESADLVTSTTHKTLAGPRSGFVLCRADLAERVDRAVFPGLQGGPLCHVTAAKAVCFAIAATPAFAEYSRAVLGNANALAAGIEAGGEHVLTGGTDTHLVLLDLRGSELTGQAGGGSAGRDRHHRQPEHRAVRRAPADGRLGRAVRDPGGDDARARRGGLARGRRRRRGDREAAAGPAAAGWPDHRDPRAAPALSRPRAGLPGVRCRLLTPASSRSRTRSSATS